MIENILSWVEVVNEVAVIAVFVFLVGSDLYYKVTT